MSTKNKTSLIGYVGADATTKEFENKSAIVNFSLATTESWTDKQGEKQEKTEWHNCSINRKTIESANKTAKYLTKGQLISLDGVLKYRTRDVQIDGKDVQLNVAFIQVADFDFLGKKDTE